MDITQSEIDKHSENEFSRRFSILVDSGVGIIHVRTHEVLRALVAIRKQAILDNGIVREWDIVNGFRNITNDTVASMLLTGDGNVDISSAFAVPLETLRSSSCDEMQYFVYTNPHIFFDGNPVLTQLLLTYSHALPSTNIVVVLVTPDAPLPNEVESTIMSLPFAPPGLAELRESITGILQGVEGNFDGGLAYSDSDVDSICYAGSGMSKNLFEMYAALAIVQAARDGKETVTPKDIVDGVALGKTDIVNSNDILELYQSASMDNVGGLENLKAWVARRKDCYSDAAKDFGIEPPKGLVLVGVPGCLSGDTVLQYLRGARSGGRDITLKDLYYKFNGYATSSRGWSVGPTYLHSVAKDGTVFYNTVEGVIYSGEKPTIRMTFSDGSALTMTTDHRVMREGMHFTKAGKLRVGDTVLARGTMLPVATGGKKKPQNRKIVSVKNHPLGSRKVICDASGVYEYRRVHRARLVVEAHMNNLPYKKYVRLLNCNQLAGLVFLDRAAEVHHIDGCSMHDGLDNLEVLSKEDHARRHAQLVNFSVDYTKVVSVVSIEAAGVIDTYDVQMRSPANNFVANGIIVHNSGKSLIAKSIASELGVQLVRLDFGRVFNSLVGASEGRMRTALKMVEAMAPIVLFCDEIDKGLGGIGGSGDSGTSSRVLGSFLTWLNDCKAPVFTIVTANNVTGLPPEMLRRGRFDAIFSTSLPTPRERREVLRIHLKLRGRNIKEFAAADIAGVINASEGYVPAEIESAVKDALVDAFSEGVEMTTEHILTALTAMVPLSKAFGPQIAAMNEWAQANATPAGIDSQPAAPERGMRRIGIRTPRKGE